MEIYITAFTLGLLGSFHCIGMCGPIAMSLPLGNNGPTGRVKGGVVYNLGRIFTYSLFGVVFGFFGQGLSFFSTQQAVSILIGVTFILSVLIPFGFPKVNLTMVKPIVKLVASLKKNLAIFLKRPSTLSLLVVGSLNGLLPCGLVYTAMAGSIVTGSPVSGGAYMIIFGIGTLPIMLLTVIGVNSISLEMRNRIRKFLPILVLCLGVLFILRGMNLGIPYVSPKFDQSSGVESCH